MKIVGTFVSSVRKVFRDTFNRTNTTGSLGTASDGSSWSAIRGTFNVSSNKATTSDSPSTYPLATVDMTKNDVTISIKGSTQGTTAALWVTDSGNWWGIGIDQTTENCNCQQCQSGGNCATYTYQCNSSSQPCNAGNQPCNYATNPCGGYSQPCNATNYSCNAYNAGNCNNGFRYPCNYTSGGMCNRWSYVCDVVGNRYCRSASYPCSTWNYQCDWSYWVCNAWTYDCTTWNYQCNAANYPCSTWNAVTYSSCNCQTCYPQYVRFIQSISNTVTTLTSWAVSKIVKSLKITTSGSTTTTKVYSDEFLQSQVDSDLVYTPAGVSINTKYGIMVKPSTYSQGNTIDEITIESN